MWKGKGTAIGKTILKNKMGEINLPNSGHIVHLQKFKGQRGRTLIYCLLVCPLNF
jgi:hypothetical protein